MAIVLILSSIALLISFYTTLAVYMQKKEAKQLAVEKEAKENEKLALPGLEKLPELEQWWKSEQQPALDKNHEHYTITGDDKVISHCCDQDPERARMYHKYPLI